MRIIKGPYLQKPTATSMTVRWETSGQASGKGFLYAVSRTHTGPLQAKELPLLVVEANSFPTASENDCPINPRESIPDSSGHKADSWNDAASSFGDTANSFIHSLTFKGLEPGTIYYYRVRSEQEGLMAESDLHALKTSPEAGSPFSFAVTSETGGFSWMDKSGGALNKRLFAQMGRLRPDLALFIGDIVNDGNQYEDWAAYFFEPGKELLSATPFYSCLGNHEDNAPLFYRYFDYPQPGNYYSFDYGDVHFICLDSTHFVKPGDYPDSSAPIGPGHAQYDFLERDLESSSARWKVVFFHYPPYVSGSYQVEAMRALCPVLEKHGVDVVLNSHTIVYERSFPLKENKVDYDNGVVYIVAGGAGAMPDWLLPKREWHTAQSLAVPHFLQVVATPERLEFRAMDDEGRLFDHYGIRKDAKGKKDHV